MLDLRFISSVELTQEFLNRSKKINPKINSVISHTEEYAIKSAKEADEAIKNKTNSTTENIPFNGSVAYLKLIFQEYWLHPGLGTI